MPVFHTKTIESILEPVALQVDRLVILHEEAEDGNAMPDLSRPVGAVSNAVANLIKVGRETINSSDDPILRQDMPASLHRVEEASCLLEEACGMLRGDPFSQPARRKLIDGARGILQGTSSLLLCFDESEVRKIIRECKKVLDYLAVAGVIEDMEDLVEFVKGISPCLTKVSRDVDARQQELTHQVHREILIRCLDQVKSFAPILICSMKVFVEIVATGTRGKGFEQANENRNYLAGRMTDEINEIIRVLQLTTYDEDEWEADSLSVMKRAQNAVESKLQAAQDWLQDPLALRGGVGEKSLRQIVEYAGRVAERALPPDREAIRKLTGDVASMVDALCELRQKGEGASPQAQALARSLGQKLKELDALVAKAVVNVEKSGLVQPAHTVSGRLDQAKRWLLNPSADDRGLGQQAIGLIVQEGRKVAEGLSGPQRTEILALCNEVERTAGQLGDLVARGQGNSPEARRLAKALAVKLDGLKDAIQGALVDRVVEDFADVATPLKQFTDAVTAPEGAPGREANFAEKAANLSAFGNRVAKTARLVAAGSGGNKKLAEALLASASQVESLTPQLVSAGQIRMAYPQNKAADEHFENLRHQYSDSLHKTRALADEATDSAKFIRASEDAIRWHIGQCEESIGRRDPQGMVDHTSSSARLGNRVLMVAKQEADNSEDPVYNARINRAADSLQNAVPPMVQDAKNVALNMTDPRAQGRWRESSQNVLDAISDVRHAVEPAREPGYPAPPDLSDLSLNADAPPRPPPPMGMGMGSMGGPGSGMGVGLTPPRPPPPAETDDEDDSAFARPPAPNQPIMLAAHGLHEMVTQWSSRDNEIIGAAKRMASLMARLARLVRGEGGTKKDLIKCAKDIADASCEVTRLAKELAKECTDKRMRTNLLQVCERIPTIGTQLKILSTVKATMLGAQEDGGGVQRTMIPGSEEDQEATDMLVHNAQNLMQSVKETVRAAEAASIKIRTDAGIRLRWIRKEPWYHY